MLQVVFEPLLPWSECAPLLFRALWYQTLQRIMDQNECHRHRGLFVSDLVLTVGFGKVRVDSTPIVLPISPQRPPQSPACMWVVPLKFASTMPLAE